MNSPSLLSLTNLSVWYTKEHPVLSGFSLYLGKHEVVGLIGLNGAGKTTFIKTIAGLLPSYHLENATWYGHPVSFRDKSFKERRYIVFAEDRSFQYFTFWSYVKKKYKLNMPFLGWLTLPKLLLFPLMLHNTPPHIDQAKDIHNDCGSALYYKMFRYIQIPTYMHAGS